MAGRQYPQSPSIGRGSISSSPDTGPPQEKLDSPRQTPRKNKRKLSEPKKRADFSIKRFCTSSPGGSAMSDSGCSEDFDTVQENPPHTPDPTYTQDAVDTSQSHGELPRLPYIPGVPTNCLVPNLYLPGKSIPPGPLMHGFPNYAIPEQFPNGFTREQIELMGCASRELSTRSDDDDGDDVDDGDGKKMRKNYKNMTRERRVEANARERSRVHTISAAFDALRKAVPSYSYNQKLSKLAILRIACSYILALARLTDEDRASELNNVSFAECVDMCTQTIQTEGRARRRH